MSKILTWLLVLILLLAACGGEAQTAESPTAVSTQATSTGNTPSTPVASTPTIAPTATLPTAPTMAAQPTTNEPAPTVTPTPAPVFLSDAADFGADRNPLTGELVEDATILQRRPIASKVSNSPPEHVRPQSGLGQADLVFEHVTEGPITRFTAVFYGQAPEKVGPIRSGRLIDVEIPAMYDAAFAYSGSSIGVSRKLFGSDFRERILRSDVAGYYRTGEDKPYEHTLYGRPAQWWEVLEERELNQAPAYEQLMAFSSEPPEGGDPATEVRVSYQERFVAEWRYDEDNGRYWRWADGEPHVDANTGDQISAANVVVVHAIHQLDQSICEFQQGDRCLSFSTEIQVWGDGPASVFRDGRQYNGRWQRTERRHMLTFYDDEGNEIPLQIGNTWFQIVPLHYDNPVTVTP